MAIYGKSLGNGYPIGAVIGKKIYIAPPPPFFISAVDNIFQEITCITVR